MSAGIGLKMITRMARFGRRVAGLVAVTIWAMLPMPAQAVSPAAAPVTGQGTGSVGDDSGQPAPVDLDIVLVRELSHDPTAFTQGLEISDGRLYESTGSPGDRSSSIRELDRATGDVLRLRTIDDVFAEGLTFVDGLIYQITWQDGVAFVRDPQDFSVEKRFAYAGEGWGLCYDGSVLVMSDGSAELHFRDPVTFERVGEPVTVTLDGEALPLLNELECVGVTVYANVWYSDQIVRIDTATGRVTAVADASDIGLPRPSHSGAVLNGIAWDPVAETFLIAGKDWPALYEVRFVAEPGEAPGTAAVDEPPSEAEPDKGWRTAKRGLRCEPERR